MPRPPNCAMPWTASPLPQGTYWFWTWPAWTSANSSGISALLSARSLAIEQGGGIARAAVPANTARILGIVGLDQVFTIHPDASTATTSSSAAR